MIHSIKALIEANPGLKDRILYLAEENPRFIKLANTWFALDREVRRYEGVKGEKDRVTQLQMMRIKMETKIQTFLR